MRNIFFSNLSSLSIYILVITSLTKITFASKSYLRLANNERNLQQQSTCTQSCNSDEIIRVLVKTSDKAGKKNALACSMSEFSTDPQDDVKIKTPDGRFILGISICLDDRLSIENINGVTSVEDDQVYVPLNSDCRKDCSSDEIERVLIQTSNELGKDNALTCSMASADNRGNVEIKMGNGYILGIGVCPIDRILLETAEGITYVEDDPDVYIQPIDSDCRKDCSSDEIERVLIQTSNELGKDNALTCSMAPQDNRGNVEIKMSSGYILGIGVCPIDRTVLENAEGITNVEDDHDVSIQPMN